MHKPLKALADIRTGYTFRGKIKEDPQGEVRVLQIKDIKGRREVLTEQLPRMQWQGAGVPPLLVAGDIVLPARGDYYHAALADGAAPIVATSQLFVLHPSNKTVTAEFLSWYLNQPAAQNYFRANRTGTSISMLSRQVLGALSVPVPTLAIQHKIVALRLLLEREKNITEQLLHNRQQMFAGIFQHLLES
jgi:hypothetical protein